MAASPSDNSEDTGGADDARSPSSEEAFSPERLSEAFAGMLSPEHEGKAVPAPSEEERGSADGEASSSRPSEALEGAGEGDRLDLSIDVPGDVSPRGILEAMLFVGNSTNEPLTARQASELMRGVSPAEIDELVRQLNASYQGRGSPYCIESQGAGYRMVLREEFAGLRDKFYGRLRL